MADVTREDIRNLFKAAVDPLLARIHALETRGGTPGAKYGHVDGKPFPYGGGPASHRRGPSTDGLSLANVIRSLQLGDKKLAPLAWDLSEKFVQCGYTQTDPRSILIPLGDSSLFRTPGHEALVDSPRW